MKKKISAGITVLAIAAIAGFNVNLKMDQQNKPSLLALENIEALEQGEVLENDKYDPNKWTNQRSGASTYTDGKLTKKYVIVDCLKGGIQSNCSKSCKYKTIKDDRGNWTDWNPC